MKIALEKHGPVIAGEDETDPNSCCSYSGMFTWKDRQILKIHKTVNVCSLQWLILS